MGSDPICTEKDGHVVMSRRNCPVCRRPLEKKHPTETVPCPCGKFEMICNRVDSSVLSLIGRAYGIRQGSIGEYDCIGITAARQ